MAPECKLWQKAQPTSSCLTKVTGSGIRYVLTHPQSVARISSSCMLTGNLKETKKGLWCCVCEWTNAVIKSQCRCANQYLLQVQYDFLKIIPLRYHTISLTWEQFVLTWKVITAIKYSTPGWLPDTKINLLIKCYYQPGSVSKSYG